MDRQQSSSSEPEKTLLHTIIFFPIDYDDPENMSIAAVENADNSLSTGPHKHMVRRPHRDQADRAVEDMQEYFQDAHFARVQRRLRSIYFYSRRNFEKEKIYTEGSDTYAAEEKEGETTSRRFLHQMPVFMSMLDHMGFRTIYARNLRSAIRHARRLKREIHDLKSPEFRPTRTPRMSMTSNPFAVSPTTPGIAPPDQKVMLLTYRMVGSRIHMDSRAYDAHVGEGVLVYPSRDEVALDSAKIYDIQAFDEVAKQGNHWRPAWHDCDMKSAMSGGTRCPFERQPYRNLWHGKSQILKRGHSSCTSMVDTIAWGRFAEPACYRALQRFHRELKRKDLKHVNKDERPGRLAKRAEQHILHNSRFYNYIHQEYVESLQSWGELRVFVRMRNVKHPKIKGKVVRRPEVFNITRTHFNDTVAKERFQRKYGPPKVKVDKEDVDSEDSYAGGGSIANEITEDEREQKRQRDEDRRRGYLVQDYNAKQETIKKLAGYIKKRGLWTPQSGRTLKRKSDYVDFLEENDRMRRAAAPQEGDPQQEAPQPETDLEGETLVENGIDSPTDHPAGANGGSASQRHPGGNRGDDFFELPDEGSIIDYTYYTCNMNVSRLNRDSAEPFTTYPRINIKVIENFALQQYRRLFRRFPKHFESLNVGARVDIGISAKQELFINEVTRWWFASWFGGYQDVPLQDEVARGFADSFAEIYETSPDKGPNEPGVESDDDEDDYDEYEGYKVKTTLYKLKRGREGSRNHGGNGGSGDEGGDRRGDGRGDGKGDGEGDGEGDGGGSGANGRPDRPGGPGDDQGDEENPDSLEDDDDNHGNGGKGPNSTKNSKKKKAPGLAEEDDAQQDSVTEGSGKKVASRRKARDKTKAGSGDDGNGGVGQEPKQLGMSANQSRKRISVDNDEGDDNRDNQERPPTKKNKKNPAKPKNTSKTKKAKKASTSGMESRTGRRRDDIDEVEVF
ncbi:hypothetical protein PMIN06_007828 [Paraphaeosphaeria minitans]